jgi:hypothetical protein
MKPLYRNLTATLLAFLTLAPAAFADAVGGPKLLRTSVEAFASDRFEPIVFRGGELAIITAIGDGDTDLDLYVYDENGRLVAKDDDGSDNCVATFQPRWTGEFRIVVRNRGSVYNRYRLETN